MPTLKLHGPWTVLLLVYTHSVYTAFSILNCPKIAHYKHVNNTLYNIIVML